MDKKTLEKNFENPSKEWRAKPFWSWNGELEKEELNRQVRVMKEMGFGGYFMHSRAGLQTEYLGKEWFEFINSTAEEGDKFDMESWLYDEDRWPSGSAGGLATEEHRYRMKSVVCYEIPIEKFLQNDFKIDGDILFESEAYIKDSLILKHRILTEKPFENFECSNGEKKVLIFSVVEESPSSVYNGNTYLDTMNLEAMEKFIEQTHEKYAKKCGDKFGSSIKGIFTDEPHRGVVLGSRKNTDGIFSDTAPWTNDLADEFKKRYGYDLIPLLPNLFYKNSNNDFAKLKINYIDLTNNLFIERFAIPYKQWCDKHNIAFTGHVLHEDSLSTQTGPNGSLMRFYEHMNIPGIDVLAGGDKCWWDAKQLDSAARQTGKKWKLSELYGCTGWETSFRDYKYLGDWQTLFGINLRCPHLSWYTMEGEAKRDYPASMLHQSTYYKDYNYVETYFARFGMFMDGTPICDTLVINPIESVWTTIHSGWANWIFGTDSDCQKIEKDYTDLCNFLLGNHVDFDYGEEEMMSRLSVVDKSGAEPVLKIGKCAYKTVIVGGMLTMRSSTFKLLSDFTESGGKVIFTGDIPTMIDGETSDLCKELSNKALKFDFLSKDIISEISPKVNIKSDGKEAENIFCRLLDYGDGNLGLAIMNADRTNPCKNIEITVNTDKLYAEEWNLESADKFFAGSASALHTDLEAAGVKTFILTDEKRNFSEKESKTVNKEFQLTGKFDYVLDEDNVLVLDYCSWKTQNGEWSNELEVLKCDRAIRNHFGIEYRSGNMYQPWYTKIHCNKEFEHIELKYEFNAEKTDCDFVIAGERPEFMEYELNGTKLEHKKDDGFWIDTAFKRMSVPRGLVKQGKNTLIVRTLFQTLTNIEAVYVLGKFGINISGQNKKITNLPSTIEFGNIDKFNLPFYSGTITYRIKAEDLPPIGTNRSAVIRIDNFNGALVKVNGKIIAWEPYEADITNEIRNGSDLYIQLVCTRRNTFGPLHAFPKKRGSYSPNTFVTGGNDWKDEYQLLDSGINSAKIIIK